MSATQDSAMTWLVFGDDWGRHPSTTQHLISNLPRTDAVYWVGSIGMRAPKLGWSDVVRVVNKLRSRRPGTAAEVRSEQTQRAPAWQPHLVPILMLPWHGNALVQRLNLWLFQRALRAVGAPEQFDVAVAANPIAHAYIKPTQARRVAYLRLDDYAHLPGVDVAWVRHFEPLIVARAQRNFATAKGLLPGSAQDEYLPQGVDTRRFASVPLEVPQGSTIGFFGLLESWVDFDLIAAVAKRMPQWTFEFIGNAPAWPTALNSIANIRALPAVDYADLPAAIAHWRGAWVPFQINALTMAVNPIKLREYLAAGLPSFSTPMPEAIVLEPLASIGADVDAVCAWIETAVATDSAAQRQTRREAMHSHTWQARSQQLRNSLHA